MSTDSLPFRRLRRAEINGRRNRAWRLRLGSARLISREGTRVGTGTHFPGTGRQDAAKHPFVYVATAHGDTRRGPARLASDSRQSISTAARLYAILTYSRFFRVKGPPRA